jgi:hypothetical protein
MLKQAVAEGKIKLNNSTTQSFVHQPSQTALALYSDLLKDTYNYIKPIENAFNPTITDEQLNSQPLTYVKDDCSPIRLGHINSNPASYLYLRVKNNEEQISDMVQKTSKLVLKTSIKKRSCCTIF